MNVDPAVTLDGQLGAGMLTDPGWAEVELEDDDVVVELDETLVVEWLDEVVEPVVDAEELAPVDVLTELVPKVEEPPAPALKPEAKK